MKTSRAIALATVAFVVGCFAARWFFPQPSGQAARKGPVKYGFGTMQQLESFYVYLQETKQTNILQRFNDYTTASLASRHYADLGVTLAILQRLRDGRTNDAYELLEGRLDTDIVGFVFSYRELPASAKEQPGLKVLGFARDYRAKFPFKHRSPIVDEAVADACKILDENAK